MCKSLCENVPMKLITTFALAIVVVDVIVLKKTLEEFQ
jgi:hypothetical protein